MPQIKGNCARRRACVGERRGPTETRANERPALSPAALASAWLDTLLIVLALAVEGIAELVYQRALVWTARNSLLLVGLSASGEILGLLLPSTNGSESRPLQLTASLIAESVEIVREKRFAPYSQAKTATVVLCRIVAWRV